MAVEGDGATASSAGSNTGFSASPWWALGGLGKRILLWMAGLALIPLVVMAYQGYHCAREAVMASTAARLHTIAMSRGEQVKAWLEERRREMELLGQSSYCIADVWRGGRRSDEPCPYVEDFKRRVKGYETIDLFDITWRRIGPAGPDIHPIEELADAQLREKIKRATTPIIFPIHAHEDGSAAVHLGHTLRDSEGLLLGFVVAALDLSTTLAPILQDRAGLGETGKVYLVSTGKMILTEPLATTHGVALATTVDSAGVRSALSGHDGSSIYADYRGMEVVGGFTWLAAQNWALIAEIDSEEALAWLGVLKRRAFMVGLFTLAAVILFSSLGARHLARPLRHLALVARRVGEGCTEERVRDFGQDELGQVGHAFNEMLDQLKKAEKELKQTAALAAVGELSSSIVHEMRNPLCSVKMNLQALSKKVAGDDIHTELAEIASEQVKRLELMLNDLLAFGRPSRPNLQPTSVGEIVQNARDLLAAEAKARRVRIVVRDTGCGQSVPLDRELMRRALTNLLKNGLEAVGEDGEIEVRVRTGREEGCLTVEVTDSGPGLPTGEEADVFKPFFTTKPNGTGLGLANVKKVIELHGGSIVGENVAGQGARFRISLPLTQRRV